MDTNQNTNCTKMQEGTSLYRSIHVLLCPSQPLCLILEMSPRFTVHMYMLHLPRFLRPTFLIDVGKLCSHETANVVRMTGGHLKKYTCNIVTKTDLEDTLIHLLVQNYGNLSRFKVFRRPTMFHVRAENSRQHENGNYGGDDVAKNSSNVLTRYVSDIVQRR